MGNLRHLVLSIGCLALLASISAFGDNGDAVTRTFSEKSFVNITLVSGDCIINTDAAGKITVAVDYSYKFSEGGKYTPEMVEEADELYLKEVMSGSCSGYSTWRITVPEKTEIKFSSASGGLKVKGLYGRLAAGTASGAYLIEDCTGELELSTASGKIELYRFSGEVSATTGSGDIEVDDIKGGVRLTTGSGNIQAAGISLIKRGAFASGSGDAEVILAMTPAADLAVSSGSGDAVLRYNGNPIRGSFELTAKYREGRIRAPFDFAAEERFSRQGEEYIRKSFTRESDSPEICIRTGSGTAALKE